jgi:hypothetical protein
MNSPWPYGSPRMNENRQAAGAGGTGVPGFHRRPTARRHILQGAGAVGLGLLAECGRPSGQAPPSLEGVDADGKESRCIVEAAPAWVWLTQIG